MGCCGEVAVMREAMWCWAVSEVTVAEGGGRPSKSGQWRPFESRDIATVALSVCHCSFASPGSSEEAFTLSEGCE